ncbi:MAG: pentapeptide repeat-containing protein [Marmoricola sp.]
MTSLALHSDCSRCFALCCVLLPYSADAGFGVDKAGGTPCHNLAENDSCTIHADLLDTGWRGCTIFECFGAGQQVSQVTYEGRSWRDPSVNRSEMAAVFSAMRVIHEMLFHLDDVLQRQPGNSAALEAQDRLAAIREGSPEEILAIDLDDLIEEVGNVLRSVSAEIRGEEGDARQDLIGRDLRKAPLTDANLRGALLIAADLRGVDLGRADLLGTDLRDAKVQGANLSQALFLTQPQLNAALGDVDTQVPLRLRHPWLN